MAAPIIFRVGRSFIKIKKSLSSLISLWLDLPAEFGNDIKQPPQENLQEENDKAEADADQSELSPAELRLAQRREITESADKKRERDENYPQVRDERIHQARPRRLRDRVFILLEQIFYLLDLRRLKLETFSLHPVRRAQRVERLIAFAQKFPADQTKFRVVAP
jgi:hypothetical protein